MSANPTPAVRLTTGSRLPNGAVVMEVRDNVILARGEKGVVVTPKGEQPQYVEYITWKWDGIHPNTTTWGHYFKSLSEAAKDFEARCEK